MARFNCGLLLSLPLLTYWQAAIAAPLSLEEAIRLGLRDNAALAQQSADTAAWQAQVAQQGSLPDPQISWGVVNLPVDSLDPAVEAMTQQQWMVTQGLPFVGKRALRREAAQQRALAAVAQEGNLGLQIVARIAGAWWQLLYVDRALTIIERNKVLLRQFVTIAQTKYKVGQGLQQDVLLAQLELSRLLDRAISLQAQREQQVAQLNALLNRPVTTVIEMPESVAEKLPQVKTREVVLHVAMDTHPRIQAEQAQLAAASSMQNLARRDYFPDFQLSATYGQRIDRTDMVGMRIGFSLPIFAGSRQARQVDQRNSELLRQQYRLTDVSNQLASEISSVYAQYQSAAEQVSLYKSGIVPQAEQTVESMLAGYQVNKVDFLNLVRVQVTLYDYQIQYWAALSRARQALATLQALAGKEQIYE